MRARARGRIGSLYELQAPTILEHLKLMQDGEKATDWYFRVGSEFIRALKDHLVESKPKDCIVDREGRRIACHRGTGYAISVKKPILHFAMPGEIEMMSFDLEIGYEPNEDDHEYEARNDRDIERAERIHYPADLELNFTKAKFDLWIQETRTKMRQERAKPELRLLEKLLKKHPEAARETILKLKPCD